MDGKKFLEPPKNICKPALQAQTRAQPRTAWRPPASDSHTSRESCPKSPARYPTARGTQSWVFFHPPAQDVPPRLAVGLRSQPLPSLLESRPPLVLPLLAL